MNARSAQAAVAGVGGLENALIRADALDDALMRAIEAEHFQPFDQTDRIRLSIAAASLALEHGRAMRVLVAEGLMGSACSLMRMQHEALTRSIWLLYAADELAIGKLSAPLTKEAEQAAAKLPMMADMLKQLAQKPQAAQALSGLLAFKENNAPALNSFVHGGIHALQRHDQGFPVPLVEGLLRNANGLMLMTAMMLAILSGSQARVHAVSLLQRTFASDLPPLAPSAT